MQIMVVDDEPLALKKALQQTRSLDFVTDAYGFPDPYSALDWLKDHPVDAALLDVEMYGMSGIELAKACKDLQPKLFIVFITGYSEYAMDAFRVHANGYLLKPASTEEIRTELLRAESFSDKVPDTTGRIQVHTFGFFEIFVDDAPVVFHRTKSKELLAFLVDRKGAGVSNAEIAATLWEERPYDRSLQNQVQMIISEMMKSLKAVKAEEIIVHSRNSLAILPDKISCDYYQFLKGDLSAINRFSGEYMSNYSWAEFTTGFLGQKANC